MLITQHWEEDKWKHLICSLRHFFSEQQNCSTNNMLEAKTSPHVYHSELKIMELYLFGPAKELVLSRESDFECLSLHNFKVTTNFYKVKIITSVES